MSRPRKPKATHRLWLGDEIPSIGSGWRGITVTKFGHKWVHLFETATGFTARISVKLWNELPKWDPKGKLLPDAEQRIKVERQEDGPKRKKRSRKTEVAPETPEDGEPLESGSEEEGEGDLS